MTKTLKNTLATIIGIETGCIVGLLIISCLEHSSNKTNLAPPTTTNYTEEIPDINHLNSIFIIHTNEPYDYVEFHVIDQTRLDRCNPTNLEIRTTYEPIITGTNKYGQWIIHFKP